MEMMVSPADEDTASPHVRPYVLVTVAALAVVKGGLVASLRKTGSSDPEGDASGWELLSSQPGAGMTLEDTARQAAQSWIPGGAAHVEQLLTCEEVVAGGAASRLQVVYFALVRPTAELAAFRAGAPGELQWWPVDALPPLPASQAGLLNEARERLRSRLGHTDVAASLLDAEFSLSELQQVYEAVQGRGLDKRNFRKWVLGSSLVEPTAHYRREGAHRPARLYRFVRREAP
jgi:ADP-ribose pyrophosphatase YjhB (NUDIX family)